MTNHDKLKYGKKSKDPRAINLSGCTLVPNEVLDHYLPLLSELELKTLLILLQAQTFPQVNFRGLTINDIQQHLAYKSESVMPQNKYSEEKIKQAVDYLIQLGLLTSKEIEDTNIFRYYINLHEEAAEETSQEEEKTKIKPPVTELETVEEGRMDIESKLSKDLNEEENKLRKEIIVEDIKEAPKPEAAKEKPETEKVKEVEEVKKAPLTEAFHLGDIQARLKSDLEKDEKPEKEKKKEEEKKEKGESKEKLAAKEEEKIIAEVAAENAEKKDIAEEQKGKDTWKAILEKSADILDTFTFQQWLAPTQYKGYKNGVHLILVPSKKFYSWFDKEFKDILDDAIMEIDPDFKYKFISEENEN